MPILRHLLISRKKNYHRTAKVFLFFYPPDLFLPYSSLNAFLEKHQAKVFLVTKPALPRYSQSILTPLPHVSFEKALRVRLSAAPSALYAPQNDIADFTTALLSMNKNMKIKKINELPVKEKLVFVLRDVPSFKLEGFQEMYFFSRLSLLEKVPLPKPRLLFQIRLFLSLLVTHPPKPHAHRSHED